MKALALGFFISVVFYQLISYLLPSPEIERYGLFQFLKDGTTTEGTLFFRILCWKVAWHIIMDHWLIGSGPWSYESLFPKYLSDTNSSWRLETFTEIIPHAHNLYLQIACESGLIGLIIFMGVIVLPGRRVWLRFRQSPTPIRGKIFFVALAVAGFLTHNLVEVNWIISTFIYHFTILIFILDFYDRRNFTESKASVPSQRKVLLLVTGVCAGLALIFLYKFYTYERIMFHEVLEVRNAAELEEPVRRAAAVCPRCAFPHLAMTAALLYEYGREPRPQLLVRAETSLKRAAETGTLNPGYLIYLSQVLIHQGRLNEAQEALSQAKKYHRFRVPVAKLMQFIEEKKKTPLPTLIE